MDSHGNIYLTEERNNRVQLFESEGNIITKWGSKGTGDGQFMHTHGDAVDSSRNVYVTDFTNGNVQKFTSDGTLLKRWGIQWNHAQFMLPWRIVIESNVNILVADSS